MIAIINGKIVTEDGIVENKALMINDGKIIALAEDCHRAERIIDVHGRFVMPGFIDVHSDKIEQFILPRPTAQMDFELALKECERELLQIGITTMYHSISLYKDEFFGKSPLRTQENVEKIAELIDNIHKRYHLIHHRFHLRIEIDNLEAPAIAKALIESRKVHEISFMDHTPGQGQYKNLEIYEETISKYHGKEIEEQGMDGIIEYHQTKSMLTVDQLQELSQLAHANGITVASHDDDTMNKIQLNKKIGVDISEFPINEETAVAAQKSNLYTVLGAPNILLGGSHSGNMSACEAIKKGCVDILCSDYYPPAILHSVFSMYRKQGISLVDMVKMVTLNPAKAMRIDKDYGSIEVGKKADLIVVEELDGYPVITHVFMDGNPTYRVEYRV